MANRAPQGRSSFLRFSRREHCIRSEGVISRPLKLPAHRNTTRRAPCRACLAGLVGYPGATHHTAAAHTHTHVLAAHPHHQHPTLARQLSAADTSRASRLLVHASRAGVAVAAYRDSRCAWSRSDVGPTQTVAATPQFRSFPRCLHPESWISIRRRPDTRHHRHHNVC